MDKLVGCCRNKLKFGGLLQPNWWSVANKLGFCAQLQIMLYFCQVYPHRLLIFLTIPENYCILFRVDIQKFLLELLYNISTLLRYLEQQWKIWTFRKPCHFQSDVMFIVFRYGCRQLEFPFHVQCSKAKNIENIFRNKLERHPKCTMLTYALNTRIFSEIKSVVISITTISQ